MVKKGGQLMKQDMLARYQALKPYVRAGLSSVSLQLLAVASAIDDRLGSPTFFAIWQCEKQCRSPKELLGLVLDLVGMPIELSGRLEDTQALLSRFYPDLPPDHCFWVELAQMVSLAFPDKELAQQSALAKGLHQLRYLISSQQAQYIRSHFRSEDMTDAQALAIFLKDKKGPAFWRSQPDYTLMESARLHNKLKLVNGLASFPDHEISHNIKILLHFHTEFILDSQGRFLNEMDGELVTNKGIINGASFNYGTAGKRHWELDIAPISRHDPAFRKDCLAGYRAPKWLKRSWFQLSSPDFDYSYFNAKGFFSLNSKSCFALVKRQAHAFRWQIWRSRLF
ncbi:DUF3114 domain-containing protein [Streptococcus equi subsp. zooepidemicus]|uniref:DUF3114 domain-containing protein n=1 Tax=Streptococcus equi TaxID=1336 RepID=UPI001E46F930|nr:DUF3114 domain-containing protein [Streptococcus equi]MCD3369468.1 DUF3114 domain-containing protein [Streptococcus equi subsp. zooepidemicus]MCD3380754.1 DUF3114 domain-containing protein [Streptococcus equi subsp. zooepidemicus]HEL0564850.1 DUF3114 domain-containing protein [Streptococcus equi subsp. zooepidemicus]HEL0661575.1 DUF3114 domain-containing protein [Streptococcus equi subsp. zooepidemicus]HEL1191897.1 DUF3114 domain-containing protein [Streptococcus equi subsp. zooepidemicus]